MKVRNYFLALLACLALSGCGETPDKPNDDKPADPTPTDPIDDPGKDPEPVDPVDPAPEALTPAKELASTFDYLDFSLTADPIGVNVSYYSDIYSRGFAWFTDEATKDTKLYLVESGKNYDADFSKAEAIDGETIKCNWKNNGKGFIAEGYETKSSSGSDFYVNVHKVHVENLKKNTSYSYKIGSEDHWKYGAFTTEKEAPKTVTAIQLSDAQTYHPELLTTFRNTLSNGVKTAGEDLDFVLYNGDYFDQNMKKVNSSTVNNILRYTKASDAVSDYKSMIPFMASSGNHEPNAPYSATMGTDINFGAFDYKGGNYSYDYGPAHFIVLNSNRLADDDLTDEDYLAQMSWLTSDLASDGFKNAKWRVVMMHISCYSTGDHCDDDDNRRLVERLTPLFSANHVDLVLQAHDHTYNKTLPYKWDAAGYSTTYNNDAVVNFSPKTKVIDGRTYDDNPNGTYYVTTGAAGHRAGSGGKDGAHEYDAGVYAEVTYDSATGTITPADSTKTYRNNKYVVEMGKLTQATKLDPYKANSKTDIAADYKVGDPATCCPDGQMFGVLNITETTLTYDAYLIKTGTTSANLFDTLSIAK